MNKYFKNSKSEYLLELFKNGCNKISYEYEAKTPSGKPIWLRRFTCMLQNEKNDVIAYTYVVDITKDIEIAKKEESYINALATEYDSIEVVGINKDKTQDKVLIHSRATDEFLTLVGEKTINETIFTLQLDKFMNFIHFFFIHNLRKSF